MLVFVLGKLCKETKALDKERAREGVCQPAGVRGELRALLWAQLGNRTRAVPGAQLPEAGSGRFWPRPCALGS